MLYHFRWLATLCSLVVWLHNLSFAGGLRGFVSDSTNGEAVIFANIAVKGTSVGGTSNTLGYYFLPDVPAGPQTIIVSYIGYRPRTFSVTIKDGTTIQHNVRLLPTNIELDELTVTSDTAPRPTDTDIGLTRFNAWDIAVVPSGVESDIFRVLQAEPGVGATGDMTARYYVRGGGGDQNLLLLDGSVIYNPFHALGVFSVIDPEIVAAMEFQKGGFSSEHAGRLSSILDIVTRDGNKNRFAGAAQLGFLSGKVVLEGPIPGGSFIVAGRKNYSAAALQRYLPGKNNPFSFYDVSFKMNTASPSLGENSRLVVHGFLSDDRVRNGNPLQEDYYVRNNVAGVSWNKVWPSPLVSTVQFSYSGYDGEILLNESAAKARSNTVRDFQTNVDFTYLYENRDELAFGVQSKHLLTRLTMQNLYDVLTSYDKTATDLHGYVSYRLKRSETFGLAVGVRVKFLTLTAIRPTFIEPRVSATYAPSPILSFKAAVGWYAQEVVTLTDETEVLSVFDPWVIVPDYVSPPVAWHFTAGVSTYVSEHLFLECEAYYKPMNNLIDINEAKLKPKAKDYINVPGRSYGTEYTIRFDPAPLLLQGSYALGWAERTHNGVTYIPKYDVRHSFHALAAYTFGNTVRLSASWTLKSGLPFTPSVGFADRLILTDENPGSMFEGMESVTLWGARNSSRLPVYHRLDLSVSSTFSLAGLNCTAELDLLNLYDRKNIFYYERDTGEEVTMLRFFPSFSLRVAY